RWFVQQSPREFFCGIASSISPGSRASRLARGLDSTSVVEDVILESAGVLVCPFEGFLIATPQAAAQPDSAHALPALGAAGSTPTIKNAAIDQISTWRRPESKDRDR